MTIQRYGSDMFPQVLFLNLRQTLEVSLELLSQQISPNVQEGTN